MFSLFWVHKLTIFYSQLIIIRASQAQGLSPRRSVWFEERLLGQACHSGAMSGLPSFIIIRRIVLGDAGPYVSWPVDLPVGSVKAFALTGCPTTLTCPGST